MRRGLLVGVILAMAALLIAAEYCPAPRGGLGGVGGAVTTVNIEETIETEGVVAPLRVEVVVGDGPLLVRNLSWAPLRIVNDKIYDIAVRFTLEGEGLSNITLEVIPKSYPHLPVDAFPREPVRRYILTPLDQVLGTRVTEEFSVNITGLRGGREYEIRLTARDRFGGVAVASIDTPYIREFENTANLDGILVAAYYYPWYSLDRHWGEGYIGSPLLGRYDSRDPIVISRHIDWATGHGIDAFIVSWWGPGSWEDIALRDYILKNPLIGDIRIAILYETLGRLRVSGHGYVDLDDPFNRETLIRDIEYLADNYFNNPSYLRINGSPVVVLYLARIFRGDVSKAISDLREQLYRRGYDIYLVGDLVYWQDPKASSEKEQIKLYNAVTPYSMYTNVKEILEDFEEKEAEKYGEWLEVARSLGIGFIPSALPGFNDTAVRIGNAPLPKSPERFEKQLEIAKTYMDKNLKMIIVTSFNEWHEDTQIEPSVEDRYRYLEILKEAVSST